MEDQFLLFKSKVSKMGERYVIYVPAGLKPAAERLHGLTSVVYVIPYKLMEKWKTICGVIPTARAKVTRIKKIRCGDKEFEIKNEKVGRELVLHLPPRMDNIYDWKEIVLALLKIGTEETVGEFLGEQTLSEKDRVYALELGKEIMLYIL